MPVRLVEILVVGGDRDALAPHVAFQLQAGVDVVVAGVDTGDTESVAVLEPYVRRGRAQVVGRPAGAAEDEWRDELARVAVRDHAADWILDARADELWWPRGATLKDPLEAMPPRYGIVQGLVRRFVPATGEGPFWERMTERVSLEPPAEPEPLPSALRPLYRADQRLRTDDGGRVPLRAWYPFEVLTFPLRDAGGAPDAVARGRPLVTDTRARDALAWLAGPDGSFEADDAAAPPFRAPDLVDDAAYAVECAAVGEVDLPKLERYVGELEGRVAWLEQRLWPRLLRRVTSLTRR